MNCEASFVRAEVSKPEECQAMVSAAIELYGRLDIAFNKVRSQ
jgi:NAD(P)-dependent dehydrogenase (short-subunit alcohol dehydrogenase family)